MAEPGRVVDPGRRALRRQANIDALIAAAHRLVLEQGENFTTQELISEADVALQTFYRYFKGKDELFLAVVRDLIATHCEALATRASSLDGPVERLRFYVVDTVAAMISSGGGAAPRFITTQHWRLQVDHAAALEEANRPFAALLQRELEAASEAGALHCTDAEGDAWLMSKLVMTVVHHHAFADEAVQPDTVADKVWHFCLAGIGGGSA